MITVKSIECFQAKLPFNHSFRHGSAERRETESVFAVIRDKNGNAGYGEGCPRIYVTGETVDSAATFFKTNPQLLEIKSLDDLRNYSTAKSTLIDSNPAAWCTLELAFLDLFAKTQNMPVESLLQRTATRSWYRYSAVLGDSKPETFNKQYQLYRQQGFTDFKMKLSADLTRDMEKIETLRKDFPEISMRADANNLWNSIDQAATHIDALNIPLWAIEEPVSAGRLQELSKLHRALGIKIILDESFLSIDQINPLLQDPDCWIVNIRISKMGGLLRSLQIADQLAKSGIQVIVGAQVGETSLLTRAALPVADAAIDLLCAQEGAFGTLLLTKDPFEPVFQFGSHGYLPETIINYRNHPGFGLNPKISFNQDPDFLPLLKIQ
jgi:L-Ala-D/L-Glu epimerase